MYLDVTQSGRGELFDKLEVFLSTLDKVLVKARAKGSNKLDLHEFSEELRRLAEEADPIRQPSSVFDPGDPEVVGRITACVMLIQPRYTLSELKNTKFYGSGIYSLYYKGDFSPYASISGSETPIYVGKADPQEPAAITPRAQGTKLYDRLNEHMRSIERAGNLLTTDFEFKYLVVKSGMQKSAEGYLIHYFKPIWNNEVKVCFGIGKHGDSATTRGNKRSPWDVLHPGRPWAADATLLDQKTRDCVIEEILAHYEKYPPMAALDYRNILTGE